MTTTRPVRIYLAMKDSPLPKAIKQVLPMINGESTHLYVETAEEADLVIFTNVQEIEREYSPEKSYAFLKASGLKPSSLPSNCMTIDTSRILVGLIDVITDASKKLVPITEVSSESVEIETRPHPDALHILVIDDTPKHITSAKSGLAGHHLTTVTNYEDAMNILGSEKFDVALIDLHLPMSSKMMGEKFKLGELVNYGVLLMVEAAHQGARFVGVVTDLSHHDDPFSAAFDHFSHFSVKIENAKVLMMHAPMNPDGSKDWNTALNRLIEQ